MTDRWLTINEACQVASVSRRSIYNWLARGHLVTRRTVGGCLRILEASLWR
jgi:excisionase family DNA binding protein